MPYSETEQIYKTLKERGREVYMMKFEDEGHGVVKQRNRIPGYSAAVEFPLRRLSPNGSGSNGAAWLLQNSNTRHKIRTIG